jgi:hypothetical protein
MLVRTEERAACLVRLREQPGNRFSFHSFFLPRFFPFLFLTFPLALVWFPNLITNHLRPLFQAFASPCPPPISITAGQKGFPVQLRGTLGPEITLSVDKRALSASGTLLVTGIGFDVLSPSKNAVAFNLGAVGTVTAATCTSLNVTLSTLPLSEGKLTVVVTSFGISSGAPEQVATIVADPTVSASSVNLAASVPTLSITGTGFDPDTPSNNLVTLSSGALGVVTASTSTSLTVTFTTHPTSLGNLTAVVSVYEGSSGSAVTVASIVAAPSVTQNLANRAQDSTAALVIVGSGFDATNPQGNAVAFSLGAFGTVSSATPTSVSVALFAPPTTTGNLTAVVTSFGGSSGTAVVVATVRVAPSVSTSSATLSSTSVTLEISGANFDPSAAGNVVTLSSGAAGSISAASATSLTIRFSTQPLLGFLGASVTSFGLSSGAAVQVANVVIPAWAVVGTAGFSAGTAYFTSLALDSKGKPLVAYQDGANNFGATVQKLVGGSWTVVGTAGFSAGQAVYTSLALDSSGTPFVAYADGNAGFAATVQKYESGSWTVVGTAGFSAGTAFFTSLALDSMGTPFVAYTDGGNSNKATVQKLVGGTWTVVGTAGFSAGQASTTSLALDSTGTPFVAYVDGAKGSKATVQKSS